jgi:hypothetical protein
MRLGGKLNPEEDVVLKYFMFDDYGAPHTLYTSGGVIILSFRKIYLYYNYGVRTREADLFPKLQDYTFRDYGKLKNFAILRDFKGFYEITVPRSYITRLQNSPIIPITEIERNIDRIYAILFDYLRLTPVNIWNLTHAESKRIASSREDLQILANMLDEAQVIGLLVLVHRTPEYGTYNFLLLVDDNTKTLLDKLIFIYTHISDYLEKEGITLKDVLEDIDLYTYVAAAAAT